jgi:hypothetical protein
LPAITTVDERGKPKQIREPPPYLLPSRDDHSLIYKDNLVSRPGEMIAAATDEQEPEVTGEKEETDSTTVFEVVWNCPGPQLGVIAMIVNFSFVDSTEWYQLKYSLKESPIRYFPSHVSCHLCSIEFIYLNFSYKNRIKCNRHS